jgi:hypothetical protein
MWLMDQACTKISLEKTTTKNLLFHQAANLYTVKPVKLGHPWDRPQFNESPITK